MKILNLGTQDYVTTWHAMRNFTNARDENSADELWLVQHPSVFTQGIAGKSEHLLARGKIPLIQTDRGGQITYHGAGQVIIYCLIDLKRLGIGVKKMVGILEQSILTLLANYDIVAQLKTGAHGVYVENAKIAALGLKVKHGKTYHGLSLNVAMDLTPFSHINPCGYAGLKSIQMQDLLPQKISVEIVAQQLSRILKHRLTH